MTNLYQMRRDQLLQAAQVDVVALVSGTNLLYFTGLHYHLSERPIIAFISREGLHFIMPLLEQVKLDARPDLAARSFLWADSQGFMGSFYEAVQTLGLDRGKRLGVDGQTMRVFEWLALQQAGVNATQVVDVGQTLLGLRAIKSADEVTAMRHAIQLSETALQNTLDQVTVGMTEREIADLLRHELRQAGTQGLAFEPHVLIGENSALPHGNTGDRVLGSDDFLLIDFGGKWQDYPADITRTFCLGIPTDTMREIYDLVQRANEAARAIVKPGVTCAAVDEAARSVIAAAGYGDRFTHRTGHGLGLDVHELPQIAAGVDTVLEAGMVFTIEPGIYLPGIGGVRIEDNILVTPDGSESLTRFERGL